MKKTFFVFITSTLFAVWGLIPANAQIESIQNPADQAKNSNTSPQANFFDNFEGGNANNWTLQTLGSWEVVQDQGDFSYHLRTPQDGDEFSTITGRTFGNFDMTLQVRSGDTAARNVFVRFGVQNRPNGYYLKYAESTILYLVNAGPNSGIEIERNNNFRLSDNQYHNLRIVRQGSNIKVYIDGTLALEHNDGTYLSGQIDIGSFKGTAYFDDVNIIDAPLQASFFDNFENGNADNWTPQTPSSWRVVQDHGDFSYHLQTPQDGDEFSTITGRTFGNFDLTLLVRSGDTAARNAFVRFGVQNRPNGYYLKFGESTILYLVTAGPNSGIEINRNNSFALRDNQYHSLRIVREGSNIKVYIDGALALDHNDGTFLSGAIDVGSFKGTAYFDDVIIIGSGSSLPELTVDRMYLRTGPNSGAEITQPVAGQQYYVHMDWRNRGAVAANNFQLAITLNGNIICSTNGQSANAYTSITTWCSAALIWPAGTNTIEGRLDANNVIVEANENDNTAIKTFVPTPASPSNLIATAISSSQINLSWADNSNNESGFSIEHKLGTAGFYQEIATVGANFTSYQNTGLSANTQYCYRVRAFNAGGYSGYSNESCATTAPLPPTIFRSPVNMSFVTIVAGTNPSSQTLQISNSGGGTLNWSVSANQNWLSLFPSSGSSTGETDNVTVGASIAGLAVGTYTATIMISAPGATNTPQTTAVTLTIAPPTISRSPAAMNFSGMVGSVNPSPQILQISNSGSGTLNWSVSGNSTWLSLSPSSGSSTGEIDNVTVSANIAGLTAGTYTATITISAPGATNTPQTTTVTLTIAPPNLTLTSIAPAIGNRLQRLNVVFTGTGFASGALVTVGGDIINNGATVASATSLTTDLTILATAATGERNFSVTNTNGQTSNSLLFTVANPLPTLTNIFPVEGNRLQTLDVVFTGTNFIRGASTPNFGAGVTVNAVNVSSSTSLTANITITASANAGLRNFAVTNAGPGGGASAAQNFMVSNPAPTLSSISPVSGVIGQTLEVIFSGTNFLSGTTSPTFGAGITLNSFSVTSATSASANVTITPAAAIGPKSFLVSNTSPGGGVSGSQVFTVNYPAPTLTSLAPAGGNRLQTLEVVFTGTNFLSGVSAPNVGASVNVQSVNVTSATRLTASVEISASAATGARSFSISNGNETSNSQVFNVTNPAPTLTALAPPAGGAGQTLDVVFTGTNFIDGATVNAGAGITVNSVRVNNPTSLTANLSIGAGATGTRSFSVTNLGPGGGTSNSLIFTITQVTLTRLTPNSGNRLQRLNVVFEGTNFASDARVTVGGNDITVHSVSVASAMSLTADLTIAANATAGPRDFTVTNGQTGGTSNPLPFTVTNPLPTLTGISPTGGNRMQTLDIVLTGSNFINGASEVNAGPGISVNSTRVTSSTNITANITITATAAAGSHSFMVLNSDPGGGASSGQNFTVTNPTPALTSINPTAGVIGQTMDLIFTGTNFFSDATIPNFSAGIIRNSFSVTSTTSLTANLTITPAATAGPKNFSVSNSGPGGGTSGTQIFMATNPLPTLAVIAPVSGNRLQTLDVVFTGADFIEGVSNVEVGSGIMIISTMVTDATSLTAKMTITEATATGPRDFAVTNGSPGGGTSAKKTFMVNNPAPTLASINPTSGGLGQTLDVVFTGTNYISGVTSAQVGAGVTVASLAVNNTTSLTAKIAIALTATPGVRNFSITNSGPGGGNSSSQTFTISNNRAPEITPPTPLLPQPEKQDLAIQTAITDDSGTLNATLQYRPGGESVFTSVAMSSTGSIYRGVIPGSAVSSRGVEYFISATDNNLTTRAPAVGSFSIRVQVANVTKPSPQPGGSEQNAYRLISAPLEAANASATAILEDDLGTYANTKWRLYGLISGQSLTEKEPYFEVSQTGTFLSGKSFFLIVKEPGKTIDSDAGQSIRTDKEFAIPLESGHNFTATPFNFIIPISKLRLKSGSAINLRTYQGNWITVNELVPWEGYYLPNNSTFAETLFVNSNLSSSATVRKKVGSMLSGWRLQIHASCSQARDAENFAGVAASSIDEWDDNDFAEPPPIGEYVSVYFPHPEWQKPLSRFSDDIRASSNPNQKWDFVVESNLSNELVTLRFDGFKEIDPALSIWLVDEALKYKQNLRENPIYQYQPQRLDQPNQFTLLIGKDEFVDAQTANTQGVPENFVLEQNFPNPFGAAEAERSLSPETAIRFGLPEKSVVTIKIFDLAGHEVTTLLDRIELPAGRHQRVWDGRDRQGRAMVSGIYFYQLNAGSFSRTMKLMLVR
jgi:hypothetical protein